MDIIQTIVRMRNALGNKGQENGGHIFFAMYFASFSTRY